MEANWSELIETFNTFKVWITIKNKLCLWHPKRLRDNIPFSDLKESLGC